MSKAKRNRNKERVEQPSLPPAKTASSTDRRKFMMLGVGGLGALAVAGIAGYESGWFGAETTTATTPTPLVDVLTPVTLPADAQNALRAAEELVRTYARRLNNPSALIHAVRAFGKGFTVVDGGKAVGFLCARFAAEREVSGKRYVYFPREVEVHDNSFLKTMLEAGVSLDQPITVGSNQYTLRDLGESAKALFRCDPQNLARYDEKLLHQHLPWGLIAFSILAPPTKPTWVNAYGETINLPEVINHSLAAYETVCDGVKETVAQGEMETLEFRTEIAKYSCAGMHMIYSYYSCLQHGYRNDGLPKRLNQLTDSVIFRLKGDQLAIDREADAVKGMGQSFINNMAVEGQGGKILTNGNAPPNTVEVMRTRKQIQMIGHALEAINYGLLHKLITLTPEQKNRLQAGEQALYEYLVKLRATDLTPLMNWYPKFVSDTITAVAHATRAMKLLTPENPDTLA